MPMDHLNSRADARGLQQNYEDAMAMISKYGKPALFLTFTCNPKWAEITKNLRPGEKGLLTV